MGKKAGLQDLEGERSRVHVSAQEGGTWRRQAGPRVVVRPQTAASPRVPTPCPLRLMLQVMDEADRLLEQGCTDFTVDLEVILAAVPARRQTLLFSATLTDTLRELQGLATNQPFFWEAQAP